MFLALTTENGQPVTEARFNAVLGTLSKATTHTEKQQMPSLALVHGMRQKQRRRGKNLELLLVATTTTARTMTAIMPTLNPLQANQLINLCLLLLSLYVPMICHYQKSHPLVLNSPMEMFIIVLH